MAGFSAPAWGSGHSPGLLVTLADQKHPSSCPPPRVPFMPLWETERKGSERWQLSNWTIKNQSCECGGLAAAGATLSARRLGDQHFVWAPTRRRNRLKGRPKCRNGKREFWNWALENVRDKGRAQPGPASARSSCLPTARDSLLVSSCTSGCRHSALCFMFTNVPIMLHNESGSCS